MIKYLLYILLFLIPLIYLPYGISPFESYKVIAVIIGVLTLFIALLVKYKQKLYSKFNKLLVILVAAIFLLSLFHLISAFSFDAFLGNVFRLQGIYLLWILLLLSLLSCVVKFKNAPFILPFISLILLAFFAYYFGLNINNRSYSTLGEPNAFAAIIIFIWPFLFFNLKNKYYLLVAKVTFIVLIIPLLVFAASSSAIVALVIQLIFILLLKFTKRVSLSTLICILLLILSLILPIFDKRSVYENRVEVWKTAIKAGSDSLIWGNGFGNESPIMHKASLELNNSLQLDNVDSAHNIFLDFFVEGGIVGLIIFISLWLISIKKLICNKNTLEIILFLGLSVCLSFNPLSVATLVQFWWLIGQS